MVDDGDGGEFCAVWKLVDDGDGGVFCDVWLLVGGGDGGVFCDVWLLVDDGDEYGSPRIGSGAGNPSGKDDIISASVFFA